jgi:hypothetical protein
MPAMHGPDASMQPVHDAGGQPHDTVIQVPHGMVNEVNQSDGGMPVSSGFGVEPPRGPHSTARIRVLVARASDHWGIWGMAASAGGKAVVTGDSGFALIDEVYGKDTADVVVRAMGYTEGRARVPIRPGETTFVVVTLADTLSAKIDDLAKGDKIEGTEQIADDSVDAGFVIKPAVTLDLPANALVTPWGMAATEAGTFSYVLLNDPLEAAVAPNGTTARAQDGSLVQLKLRALFEARVTQGGTIFALTKPAGVDVPIAAGAADAAAGSGTDHLYWFDPSAGAFVEAGAITEKSGIAHGEIDHFGLWAIGRPATTLGCLHGQVQDGTGTAAPFAVLRTTQVDGLGSQLIWADAGGNYCAEADRGGMLQAFGLAGSTAQGLLRIDATLGPVSSPADATAPLCASDTSTCTDAGALMAMPYGLRCVQGMIEQTTWSVRWLATLTASESPNTSGTIEAGKPFCIEVPADSSLQISTDSGNCGDMQAIAAGPSALCGEGSDCVDLGTLKCCEVQETCGDSKDNDCDSMVDEGCMCGSAACNPAGDICCTPQETCGFHAAQTKKCVAPDTTGLPNVMCPDAMFDSVPLTGCCRSDMRCGIMDNQFGLGCVAREDATDVFPLDAPLAPLSCTQ